MRDKEYEYKQVGRDDKAQKSTFLKKAKQSEINEKNVKSKINSEKVKNDTDRVKRLKKEKLSITERGVIASASRLKRKHDYERQVVNNQI